MYSLCKNAFALIYGLSNLGGLSQQESSPVLLKELYSYPVDISKPRPDWDEIRTGIEFSKDEKLYFLRSSQAVRRSSMYDADEWNYHEPLEILHNRYIPVESLRSLTSWYNSELHADEIRINANGKMFFLDSKNFDLKSRMKPFEYMLTNRKKNMLVVGDQQGFILVNSMGKQDAFECKHPQHTLDAINFIGSEQVIYTLSYNNDIYSQKHPHTCIQMLDVKTKEETRFIKLQTPVFFNAIAATDDLVLAGHINGITLWDRNTKNVLANIPYDCRSIALHPKHNTCAMLHYQEREWTTGYKPHITAFLLPRISLFKKENMLTMLGREKPTAQFHFSE